MAIVKTTAPGEDFPGKKKSDKPVTSQVATRPGNQARPATTVGSKTFLQDTIAELRRVVWPSQEQRIAGTVVTIGLLIFFSLYIYGLDRLISVVFTLLGLETDVK
jgi:preprotein translocase SecE subunit